MTTPASLQTPPRWQHRTPPSTSKHPYFSKSSEDQRLLQLSFRSPGVTYRNCSYASASAALDAYIRDYEKKAEGHQQKYENELIQLLVGRPQNVGHSSGEQLPSGAEQLAAARKLVEESYSSRVTESECSY